MIAAPTTAKGVVQEALNQVRLENEHDPVPLEEIPLDTELGCLVQNHPLDSLDICEWILGIEILTNTEVDDPLPTVRDLQGVIDYARQCLDNQSLKQSA